MDNRGSGGNNFLLGIVVGAAAVFLLGTDKGRKVLKTITEEGFEGLSDMIERAEEEIVRGDGDEPEPEPVELQKSQKESPEETTPVTNGNGIKKETKKRFFRRPSKS